MRDPTSAAGAFRKDPRSHAEKHTGSRVKEAWGSVARRVGDASGSVWAFLLALVVILTWGVTGPLFGFSDTWQLVINTGTTIVTFLMVFLIQHSQNRDTKAIQVKLNELIAAVDGASNKMIDVEDLSEDELNAVVQEYQELVARVEKDDASATSVRDVKDLGDPEARPRQQEKRGGARPG